MIGRQGMKRGLAKRELVHILWRCNECDSFISTHSVEIVHLNVCPVCSQDVLTYCGTFENITDVCGEDNPDKLLQ